MDGFVAENFSETRFIKAVFIWIYSAFIHIVQAHQWIAHLIGRIWKLKIKLLTGHGNALEQYRKSVSAEYGEYNAYVLSAQLVFYILCYMCGSCIVSLGSCNNCLGNGYYVPIIYRKTISLGSIIQAVAYFCCQIISLPEYGTDYPSAGHSCISHFTAPFQFIFLYRVKV